MERLHYQHLIQLAFKTHPIVAILGPRQCGKTTLSKLYAKNLELPFHLFDLEDPTDIAKLENPKLTLAELSGLIIIDEIQRLPNLFPYLRVLVDNAAKTTKFLILGSASRDLIRQSSETLAGRIAYLELNPFSLNEVNFETNKLWLRGGFPRSFLADDDLASWDWRKNYITTFLERDIPNLGIQIPPQQLRRFWMMLAHYHAGIFNASELGNSLGLTAPTMRRYLDILTGTFMVRQLQPWWVNIQKRQVKSPKIYFRDNGILHSLLNISDIHHLQSHPKLGASWEGFALEEIIRAHNATPEECYFWATHTQSELDLLIIKDGKKLGFELKYTDTPRTTRSMHTAMETLELDQLFVIFPGDANFPLTEKIRALGLKNYVENLSPNN